MLIIFDLDDTLLDTTNRLTPIVFLKTLKVLIQKGLRVDEKEAYQTILKIDQNSSGSKETIKKFLYDLKANKIFYKIAIKAMDQPLDNDIKIFTFSNVIATLKHLTNEHTLALVSVGNSKLQFEKMKKAGIDRAIFSKIVITKIANKGLYYKKIMKDLKYFSNETYVCGDKIDVDLLPAKKLGCKTIQMESKRKIKSDENCVDYMIKSFEEIKKILDKK